MKEIKTILNFYHLHKANLKMALAVVVRVEGSSYRRMGAKMLVAENGTWIGGISGGCLEGDALKRARMAILKESASVITYDTSSDDEHQIGVGLGCNGVIEVMFIPINSDDQKSIIHILENAILGVRKTSRLVLVTKCENKDLLGQLRKFDDEKDLDFLKEITKTRELSFEINKLEKSKNLVLSDNLTLFVEVLPPSLQILLIGHQYDLYPLNRQIKELGWDCLVMAEPSKVKLDQDIQVICPEEIDTVVMDAYTAVILMSHSLKTDKKNLEKVLGWPIRYIGMLGPKVRSERIISELRQEGVEFTDSILQRIYAPVGLDIGANHPEEIALSIIVEIKKVFSGRNGAHLRERLIPINEREQTMNFKD